MAVSGRNPPQQLLCFPAAHRLFDNAQLSIRSDYSELDTKSTHGVHAEPVDLQQKIIYQSANTHTHTCFYIPRNFIDIKHSLKP